MTALVVLLTGLGVVISLTSIVNELRESNRLKKLELQYKNKEVIPISEIHKI